MSKILSFFLILLFPLISNATYKIGIIDSGLMSDVNVPLCSTGHYDFVSDQSIIGYDHIKHGTNITLTINEHLKSKADYCFVIVRIFGPIPNSSGDIVVKAMKHMIKEKVDVINFSITGYYFIKEEYDVFKKASEQNIKMFVSAGNDNFNLKQDCVMFPACYLLKNMIVVGAKDYNGKKAQFSNFGIGIVTQFEEACSNQYVKMCGTSQATAHATGKYVNGVLKE